METTALGTPLAIPILISPTGFQGLAHPEGECATAQAVGAVGSLMAVSTFASRTLEDVARAATGPLWFQLTAPTRLLTEQLLRRAEASRYRAIVISVDAPRSGNRERVRRLDFRLPTRKANFGNEELADAFTSLRTWDALAWMRSLTSLPLLLKGILTAEDARLAVEHGLNGIIVSNHGGRQLDGAPATIEALPEIVEAVSGRCEVYIDSGIRRGTDIFKALALGARAVFVGRPILWGLAVNGTGGVEDVLGILRAELALTMALAGCPTLSAINRSFLRSVG